MIKEALDAHAGELQRAFAHDRSQTVGASEVGTCARKVYYSKVEDSVTYGIERDTGHKDGWGARVRGTVFEDQFWYPAMKAKFGDKLLYAGPDQKTFVKGYASATPDGLVIAQPLNALKHLGVKDLNGDCFMAECKTADPRTNLDEPKPENAFQVQMQMGLVRDLTDYKPAYSVLSYTNASFWDEVVEFAIAFDPGIYQIGLERANKIMTTRHPGALKPEGWIGGGSECEYCPFTTACGITRRSVPKDGDIQAADPQFVVEIGDMIRDVRALESNIELGASILREKQQAIRDRLREKNVRKIPGVVSWSSVKGRKTYDNKRIQEWAIEAGLDIEAYAKIGEETDRLTITAPKETA